MHIFTVVKISAPSEEEAVKQVKQLVANSYESLPTPFDWYSEEDIKVSDSCKTIADFKKIRELEIQEYKANLKRALKLSDKNSMKGYYIRKAGESLEAELFWSTERLAYDYDEDCGYEADPNVKIKVFYIETNRHC